MSLIKKIVAVGILLSTIGMTIFYIRIGERRHEVLMALEFAMTTIIIIVLFIGKVLEILNH